MSEPMPPFELSRPQTVGQAVKALNALPEGRLIAGGTDLIANMRRGLVESKNLIDISAIAELHEMEFGKDGLRIGAGVTLREICNDMRIRADYPAIAQASDGVAGPGHRAAATIGGNLCQDTRCIYYNQSHWWRKSNGFCLKFKGDICHVAPTGRRCRAAFSGDLAPALIVHGTNIQIAGPGGTRRVAIAELYNEDGSDYLRLAPDEIIIAVHLPAFNPMAPVVSAYEKVRMRGAIDYPLAGVAVSCRRSNTGEAELQIAVTGTNSAPFLLKNVSPFNAGDGLDNYLADLSKLIQKQVSPQRTTTAAAHYRRLTAAAVAQRLARKLLLESSSG